MIVREHVRSNAAVRIAVTYALAAAVWIVVSDRVAADAPAFVQSSKGLGFVVVTAVVLLVVLDRELRHREEIVRLLEQERAASDHLFAATPEPAYVFDVETLHFLAVNDAAIARYGWTAAEFREMTVLDIRPPDERERLGRVLADLTSEHRDFGLWRHQTKDGRVLDVHISAHGILYEGRRAELVIARDETEFVREAEARRARGRRQEVLAELSALALAEPVLPTLFARACGALVTEDSFAGAAVVQIADARRVLWAIEGEWTENDATADLPLTTSAGDVRVAFAPGADGASLLFASIVGRVETWGALATRATGPVDDEAALFLEALAHLIGTAVARREMRDALARAEEEERQRISEDIHDDPLQLLIAVGMRLQLLHRRHAEPELRAELEALLDDERRAIERLRAVMFELHPRGIEDAGLAAALEQVLQRVAGDGLTSTVENRTDQPVPTPVATILFRSGREAIMNVARHAQARHVEVTISSRDDGTALRIRDDGRGFEPADSDAREGHLGLVTMRERVTRAGGSATIESGPQRGTTVELWVPHHEASAPDRR